MRVTEDSSCPYVSVIVPVYNDAGRIGKCIEALLNQTYPHDRYEIIIVDNGSTDETVEVIKKYPVTLLIEEKIQGSYAARNTGIRNAEGEIIAFTDSDCIPSLDWIEKGVKNLLRVPDCGLVAGKVNLFFRNPAKLTAVELYEKISAFPQKSAIEKYRFGLTANLFTFKKVFEKVGFFDERLKSGGDHEWGKRVFSYGYNQIFAEDVCVSHPARYSFSQLYKKTVRVVDGIYDWKGRNTDSFPSICKEFILHLERILVISIKLILGLNLSEGLNGTRQEIQYASVFAFVGFVQFWEKIRLKFGANSKR